MASGSEFVTLAGGLTTPLEPMLLLFDLEDRGVRVELDGGDLLVRPRDLLTETDQQNLRRWKRHILALLAYVPPDVM
jgi:hypothetical protein